MLRVLIDKYGVVREKGIIITSQGEYAQFWNEIIEIIDSEDVETVVLRNPDLESYFQNLKERFGNKVEIQQVLPCSEWEKIMGFPLPPEIGDKDIAALLLSKHIGKLKEKDNKKLGTLCILSGIADLPDFTVEDSLMESILRNVEHKYPQLVTDIIDETIKSLPARRREFWQRLREERSKKEALLDAIKSLIVKDYPSDSIPYKKYYKESLTYLGFDFPSRFSHYINDEFKMDVKRFLREQRNNSIFSFVSGKLKEEWEMICSLLRENPIQDEPIISSLLRKALEYPDIYEEIRKYIPISPPPKNINEENIENWIDQYFAFYLYTRRIGKPEDTEDFVKLFDEFFLEHYFSSTDFFTQHSILTFRQRIEEHLKTKRKVLLLVVDGLSYSYCKEIEKIFGEKGSFIFSTLPTVTEINKQRILSGLLDLNEAYNEIAGKFYEEYRWEAVDSDKKDLKHFLGEDYDFYIYWENQFDNYIHRPMIFEKRFKDHVEILIKISKDIESFLESGGIVLLVGDHGYTTLPPEEDNKLTFSVEGLKIKHNRVLEVKNGKKEDISVKSIYWINENVAIAQSYHYFNSLPRGATHGGTTPEEVIVPFFVIEKKEELFSSLEFKLSEEKYLRKRKHVTYLTINNPNTYQVEVVSIRFMPSILKVFSPMPLLLKPRENILEVELDVRTITTEQCKVFVECKVNEKVYQSSFDIPTTGAIKEAFDEWE